MYWLVLIVCFFVLPAMFGIVAYYRDPVRFDGLMKWRQNLTADEFLISTGVGYLLSIAFLLGLKLSAENDVRMLFVSATAIVFFVAFAWLIIEYQVLERVKNNWKPLSILSAGVFLVLSAYVQVIIDTIIVDLTLYHASDFSTAQLALFLIVMPVIWYFLFCIVIGVIALYMAASLLILMVSQVIRKKSTLYAIYRFFTNRKLRKLSERKTTNKMLSKAVVVLAFFMVMNLLPKITFGYFSSDEFNQLIKTTLVASSFLSSPDSCTNIKNVDGVKIAMLTRDRIAVFQEGAEPEFSKAICKYRPSPLLKVDVKS